MKSDCDVDSVRAVEMIQSAVYGQAIIILVYVPLLTFTGVEGKDVRADGADGRHRAGRRRFVLSLTFVPAAIAAINGAGEEKQSATSLAQAPYEPGSTRDLPPRRQHGWRHPPPTPGLVCRCHTLVPTLGQEFTPTLDEKNIVLEVRRIPSTALSQSASHAARFGKNRQPHAAGRRCVFAHRHT